MKFKPVIFFVFAHLGNLTAQINLAALGSDPRHYFCIKATNSIQMDGIIDEPDWKRVSWSENFVDIEGAGKPNPFYQTRMKMLWNDSAIYVAAELVDEHIWAYQTDHDDIVYRENDFELFLSPGGGTENYYEIEVNAINTIFDLVLTKPYRNGGKAIIPWNAEGLKSGIQIVGTLNDGSDLDKLWTVEMKIPFSDLSNSRSESRSLKGGDHWRINFSRVQYDTFFKDGRYHKQKDSLTGKFLAEYNWVWSPQGVIDMHYPERWGYLIFLNDQMPVPKEFVMPYEDRMKAQLWQIYYLQRQSKVKNKAYSKNLAEFGIKDIIVIGRKKNVMSLDASSEAFRATIANSKLKKEFSIDQSGIITSISR